MKIKGENTIEAMKIIIEQINTINDISKTITTIEKIDNKFKDYVFNDLINKIFNTRALKKNILDCVFLLTPHIINSKINTYKLFLLCKTFLNEYKLYNISKEQSQFDYKIKKYSYENSIKNSIAIWKAKDNKYTLIYQDEYILGNYSYVFNNSLLIYSSKYNITFLLKDYNIKQDNRYRFAYFLDIPSPIVLYKSSEKYYLYEKGNKINTTTLPIFNSSNFMIFVNENISYILHYNSEIYVNKLYLAKKIENDNVILFQKHIFFQGKEIYNPIKCFFSTHLLVYDLESNISIFIENYIKKIIDKIHVQEILQSNLFWHKQKDFTIYIYKGIDITDKINSNNKCNEGKFITFNNLTFILPNFKLKEKGIGITYKPLTTVERMYDLDKQINKQSVRQYCKSIFPELKHSNVDKEIEEFIINKSNKYKQLFDIDMVVSLNTEKLFDYVCQANNELTTISILSELLNE